MADVSRLTKPPRKGEPPKPAETRSNLLKPAAAGKVPLQLKISPELRRDFHVYAASHDLDANELFEQVWDYYKQGHA